MYKKVSEFLVSAAVFCIPACIGWAQMLEAPASSLTARSIRAIGYLVGGGATSVDLKNTGLMAAAAGRARVESKPGVTKVEADIRGLRTPTELGAEFLTFVLWAVSPDGRAMNLGGIPFDDDGHGKLKATTPLHSFSLFVTAEPYSPVRQPSEMIILENGVRKDTKGKIFVVNDYKLMKRSQYQKLGNPLALTPDVKNVPLEMYEARNAVDIAQSRAADKYAPEIFTKAEGALKIAENTLARQASRKEIMSAARQVAQFAEDARALSVERQEEERIVAERAAAAAKATVDAEAKAAVEAAEARRRADEESRRQAELAAARQAQIRAEAAARETQIQAQAEITATRARAEAEASRAKEEAANAEVGRARQTAAELRARLLDQFNRILETRDSPRGLIVTMADVLFDTGKYDLGADTREKLARFAGIVMGHPELRLEVEGHTDSTGSEEFNQKLSDQRAQTVRSYLIRQGLPSDCITAIGLGMEIPVADNTTAVGRQKNRRVELIVSGEVIGVKIGK